MKRKIEITELPKTEYIEAELSRQKYRSRYRHTLRNVIIVMITASAIIVLLTMLLMPVLRIYGKSMTPTLESGNIVVSMRYVKCERGDIVAFYYNNKVLVKRVIAVGGDEVNILDDGTVTVNGTEIDESYLERKEKGECDIDLPYIVPEEQLFVMGDSRSTSVDSRSSEVGCIDEEQLIGKIIFRVFPLKEIGFVK